MRQGLAFAYGALTEHLDPDQRADVDAFLEGRPLPSELKAKAEREAALWAMAEQGDIVGMG